MDTITIILSIIGALCSIFTLFIGLNKWLKRRGKDSSLEYRNDKPIPDDYIYNLIIDEFNSNKYDNTKESIKKANEYLKTSEGISRPKSMIYKRITTSKKKDNLLREPPKIISNFTHFLPKEFRDEFQTEVINCVKDGINDKNTKRKKNLFVVNEIWNLILLIGKYKMFGFVLKRRKTIQPPS